MTNASRMRLAVCIIWTAGACQGALFMATLFVSLGVAVVFAISALNLASMLLAGGVVEDMGDAGGDANV